MSFIKSMALAAVIAVAAVAPAVAAEFKPYTTAEFQAAQAQGRPTLVHAHAGWCPICHRQAKVIKETTADAAYAQTLVLTINYDKQKPELDQFGIKKQSTLIAFKSGKEQGRLSYDSDAAAVNNIVAKAK